MIDFSGITKIHPGPYITRNTLELITGGLITAKYLANLDCAGKGPEGRVRVGRKIAYPTLNAVRWLEERTKSVEKTEV